MMLTSILRKIALGGALLLSTLVVLFSLIYQPWVLHWGANEEEILRQMPGDEIVDNPTFNATRSVTIDARPEEIWPWLVQMGYGKAGFYSHDRLDNAGIPSAKEIIPEYQSLQVGDLIPLTSASHIRVESLQPNHFLLLVYGSESRPILTWVWGLYPTDQEQTRMVVRLRWHQDHTGERIMTRLFEIIMMKKHILGIKKRAESAAP